MQSPTARLQLPLRVVWPIALGTHQYQPGGEPTICRPANFPSNRNNPCMPECDSCRWRSRTAPVRSPSTISREVRRKRDARGGYSARVARHRCRPAVRCVDRCESCCRVASASSWRPIGCVSVWPRCANYRMARVVAPTTGRIYECNRTTCGESSYMLLGVVSLIFGGVN